MKEEFNDAGNEVSESQHRLETILTLSQKCSSLLASIRAWLDKNESFELVATDRMVTDADVNAIASKLFEMSKYKYSFVELNRYVIALITFVSCYLVKGIIVDKNAFSQKIDVPRNFFWNLLFLI